MLHVRDLGRTSFSDCLDEQQRLVQARRRGEVPDTVLLTEHDPVVTVGRGCAGLPPEALEGAGIPVVEASRGGDATFHGPGQLVGYPILDLGSLGHDLHGYMASLQAALVRALAELGCAAGARDGMRGVWVGERKIASLGVAVRGWVTYHGFALNVDCDLAPFSLFAPCGLPDVRMTSLAAELGRAASVAAAKAQVVRALAERLGYECCLNDCEPGRGLA